MNRYRFSSIDPSETKDIKIGMKFTNTSGNVATVLERLPGDRWRVSFTHKYKDTVSIQEVTKGILLRQIEECKKPKSVVEISYE